MPAAIEGIEHEISFRESIKFDLHITVPWQAVDEKLNELAGELKKSLPIPGYRPGRAPIPLIRTMFRKALESEVEKWLPELVDQVVNELKLDLFNPVKIKDFTLLEDAPLVITCEGMVWPEVELKPFEKVKIKKKELEKALAGVEKEVIEEEITRTIERSATLQPVSDRPIQEDDVVRLRVRVFQVESQREVTSEEGEEVTFHLNNPRLHKAIKEHLLGREKGDTVQFEMDVLAYEPPDDDPEALYRYRRMRFDIVVEDIYTVELPPRQEIMEQEGYESEEEWYEVLREKLAREIRQKRYQTERKHLLDALVAREPDLPPFFIRGALSDVSMDLFSRTMKGYENALLLFADREKMHDEVLEEARKRITRDLVVHHLERQHEIDVSEEEVDRYLEEIAAEQGLTVAFLRALIQRNPQEFTRIRDHIVDRKVMDFVRQKLGLAPETGEPSTDEAGEAEKKAGPKKRRTRKKKESASTESDEASNEG